jgi:hypothetical protein
MDIITVNDDIKVFYVTASSFPDGILAAHQHLHSLMPFSKERQYYGISRPEDGTIIYRAGATELHDGELADANLESLILKKGKYISKDIHDYMSNLSVIGNTFQQMIARDDIDPQGYCVEWYISNKDVRCMVRMKD